MPGRVRAVVSVMLCIRPIGRILGGWWVPPGHRLQAGGRAQARTQAASWRARPRASSRRRLTAATRTGHHSWLRAMPR
jgi:hypothetical protein